MRGGLAIVGIALLVALDVVLVYQAVRHTYAVPPAVDVAPGSALATHDDGDPSSGAGDRSRSPDGVDDPEQSSDGAEDPDERPGGADPDQAPADAGGRTAPEQPSYSSVAVDGAYIRATRGDCQRGLAPSVVISSDLARTAGQVQLPDEVTEILRVQATTETFWVVGANRQCEVGMYTTSDAGASWERITGARDVWHLVLDRSLSRVHAPLGVVETPCVPTGISASTGGATRVLCEQGRIIGSADSGETWVYLGSLPGAVAIDYLSPGTGYAVAQRPGCPAAMMSTSDGGFTWSPVTCFEEGEPRSVAAVRETLVALVGDDVHVSTDGGGTWTVR